MGKEDVSVSLRVCVCVMEYYSAIKKDEIQSIVITWKEPKDVFSEINKPGTERQAPYGLTHVEPKKIDSQKLRADWWLAGVGEKRRDGWDGIGWLTGTGVLLHRRVTIYNNSALHI